MRTKERRKHPRHQISIPVEVSTKNRHPSLTNSVDVSLGGLCLLWTEPLKKQESLTVRIHERNRMLSAQASVAYCIEDKETGLFRTGLALNEQEHEFSQALRNKLQEIDSYIHEVYRESGNIISEEQAAYELFDISDNVEETDELCETKKIVIASSESDENEFMKEFLESLGYVVYTARNSQELHYFVFSRDVDLLLIDTCLGEEDGAKVYDTLLCTGLSKKVPALFLSSPGTKQDPELAAASHRRLLPKQGSVELLAEEIGSLLSD